MGSFRTPKIRTSDPGDIERLGNEILRELRDVHGFPGVVEAAALVERLRTAHKRVESALADARDPVGTPQSIGSIEQDVAVLLAAGGDPEALAGTVSPVGHHTQLLRQLHALERAVPAAERRHTLTIQDVRRQELERLRPRLEAAYSVVLRRFEDLLASLRWWKNIVDAMGRAGLSEPIGGGWTLTPVEDRMLFAQNNDGIECYVANRRRGLGLDDDGK